MSSELLKMQLSGRRRPKVEPEQTTSVLFTETNKVELKPAGGKKERHPNTRR